METFAGGCHCGRVRFEVDVEARTALECNCSICFKKAYLHVIVPRARFRLLQGAGVLSTYRFNTGVARHTFCGHCGVQAFYTPRSHPDGVSVNLRCLDDRAIIASFEIQPFDGQDWEGNVAAIQ